MVAGTEADDHRIHAAEHFILQEFIVKIIHCSDLHLDADLRSKYDSPAASGRRAELLGGFGRLCRWAQVHDVDAVLICGDLFDTDTPSPSAVRTVEDLILANEEILFFYLRGNHDSRQAVFSRREKPGNLILFDEHWAAWDLAAPAGGRSSSTGGSDPIHGHSGGPAGGRSICIAGREPGHSPLTAPALDPSRLNIVMLHGQITEGQTGLDPESIPLGLMRGCGIDYLALGHLHHYRSFTLDARGKAAYSGCLEGRGFDECGDCGFILIDTGLMNTELRIRFVPFASRRIYRIPCDITGCMSDTDAYDRIADALDASPAGEHDLVRLELTGDLEYGCSPDPSLVQRQWEGRYHYFDYINSARPVIHSEDFVCDATLKGEFVRTVCAAGELGDEQQARILRCGLRALSGEPLF